MSDYETMQRRRSMAVGIFVLVAMVAFFWMIFKFGDLPIFVSEIKSYEVRIQFASAPGVQKDTPVRFCGYQIGTVTDVRPPEVLKDLRTNQYYYQTLVIMSIDNKFKDIPESVEARLLSRGFGSSYIELRVPPKDLRAGKFLTEGSLLQGSTGTSSEFFPEESMKKLDDLITGLTALVNNTNQIVGDEQNKNNVKTILANASQASQQATEALKAFQDATAAGKTAFQDMGQLTNSLVNTSDKLGETLAELKTVLEKVNSGEGTAGKLVNDGRLYEQLLEDSRQLDLVLKEIKSFVAESKEKGLPLKLK